MVFDIVLALAIWFWVIPMLGKIFSPAFAWAVSNFILHWKWTVPTTIVLVWFWLSAHSN